MRSISTCLLSILACAAALPGAHAAVDEQALHALLAERVDVRRWGTAIVVGISSPQGRRVVSYGTLSVNDDRTVGGDTLFEIASLTKVLTVFKAHPVAEQTKP